jgi:hypothetical protein
MPNAGELVRAADVVDPSWIPFTPSLTNVTVGDGTLTGRYQRRAGNEIVAEYRLVSGATTNITGTIGVNLPVNVDNSVDYGMPYGTATARQAAATGLNVHKGVVVFAGLATQANIITQGATSGGTWNATVPASDIDGTPNGLLNIRITYPGVPA